MLQLQLIKLSDSSQQVLIKQALVVSPVSGSAPPGLKCCAFEPQCFITFTESIRTIRDGEPRMAT